MGRKKKDDSEPTGTRPAQSIPRKVGTAHLRRVSIPGSPPAGQPFCPARPKGEWPHTNEEVEQWVKAVIEGGKARGLLYTAEAVRYFATSEFWPYSRPGVPGKCPEHERVRMLAFQYALEEHKLIAWYARQDRELFYDDAPDDI